MDIQKVASTGTAVAVIGGGSIFGGNFAIDQATGGPEKRIKAKQSELQLIVREEVRSALAEMLPTTTGGVMRVDQPQDYRKEVPKCPQQIQNIMGSKPSKIVAWQFWKQRFRI